MAPIATMLDAVILAAFAAELVWMLRLTSFLAAYLSENWLNAVSLSARARRYWARPPSGRSRVMRVRRHPAW